MKAIYLPANLDLNKMFETQPPSFTYDTDFFRYLIGLLVRLREFKDNKEAKYIELNAQILQAKRHDYNLYLDYLRNAGIIERNLYIVGLKSRGYKLSNEYTLHGYALSNASIKFNRKRREQEIILKKEYGYLTKWFNDKLSIDYAGGLRCLEDILLDDVEKRVSNAEAKYYINRMSLDKLYRKIFEYNVDGNVKRFHSNLTNLKSELRNYITYDGQQLCSVDVKNSQPFISTILFNPEFYKKEKGRVCLYTLSPSIYNTLSPLIPSILSILPNITSSIMLVKSHESEADTSLQLYCTLVDKGRLYPYLSEQYEQKTGIKLAVNNPSEKKLLKAAVFTTFFSDNRFYGQKEAIMKRFFKELFPDVYQIFSLIKRKGNELLPIILQLVESEIMIRRISRRISTDSPSLPIFTIHDSIATLTGARQQVCELMKIEFEAVIGLQPSLEDSTWELKKTG